MSLRVALGKLVFALHIISIVVLLFGWLLSHKFLQIHLCLILLTVVQWWFNKNRCVLTQLQAYLEQKPLKTGEQGQFVKKLFNSIGINPSERQLFYIIYGLLFVSFLLSFFKFQGDNFF